MKSETMTQYEIERHTPDFVMPPIYRETAPSYWFCVDEGEQEARRGRAVFLGLCRNSMPWIAMNLRRLEKLGSYFKEWAAFIYENDSVDGTDECLKKWQAEQSNGFARCEKHDRPQLSHEKSERRTTALAEYRQACLDWASDRECDYVIVIDFDTWGGWSNDGVMNGIGWLSRLTDAAGMASVSTVEMPFEHHPEGKIRIHYDSWAARQNHWSESGMGWFPHFYPPVGSDPIPFWSAFGGMAIYRPSAFFVGKYAGPDCEHVAFHRSIRELTGMGMYLNPSQRIVMNWIPESTRDGGKHGDD